MNSLYPSASPSAVDPQLSTLSVERVAQSQLARVDFSQLRFGGSYGDHMFLLDAAGGQWHSPRIVPYGPLQLDPACATLHYGQAVFEGLKAFRGGDGQIRLFRPDRNAQRLYRSCERLCIPPIDPAVVVAAVERLVAIDHAWVPHQRGQSLYIRPVLFAAEPHLEVRPSDHYRFIIFTAPVGAYISTREPVALCIQRRYSRAASGGVGFAKTAGNYAASLYPTVMSQRLGYHQTLWLDGAEHRYLEEAGYMNIFFVIEEQVITPPLEGTILPGVMRESIIQLLRDEGLAVVERRIALEELLAYHEQGLLREVFGTGTAAVVSPVGRIAYGSEGAAPESPLAELVVNDNRPGPLAEQLLTQITALQYGEAEDRHGWTVVVAPENAL